MGEYSPKRHDIAQLKLLCETLYHDCFANLEESNHSWVNDPTSAVNLQLNELAEHIVTFAFSCKIKYNENNKLIEQIDEYLGGTSMLFSSYGVNTQNLQKQRRSDSRLFRCFVDTTREGPTSLSYQDYYNRRQKYVRKAFNENRLSNAFMSLLDN